MSDTSDTIAQRDPEAPDESGVRRIWAFRLIGPLLGVLTWLALGAAGELPQEGRIVAGVGVLMAVWWMSEALPLSATALLPIVAFPAFGVLDITGATAPYANDIVFLFMGGFMIAIAMQKWNLHRRIALMTLKAVGTHPRRIVLGMMLSTGFLSMWVSNTATTLMMLPIALSVLNLVVERSTDVDGKVGTGELISETVSDPAVRTFGVGLVLSVAWAASIGGLATLLGSPPNAIVAGYLSEELDRDIGFVQWMQLGLPLSAVFILVAWLLITRVLFRSDLSEIPGGAEMIRDEIAKLGPVSREEKSVLAVFVSAAFLWIAPGLLAQSESLLSALPFLDGIEDTAVAIAAGIALFIIPSSGRGTGMLLEWEDAQRGLPWGVLLLFGGGLSLAAAVSSSGLDEWIGTQVSSLGVLPLILLVGAVVALVLMLTEVTSNTATAATFIPVLGGVALGLSVDATTLLVPAALAATCAFMLPVGTPPNAIVFGSGVVTIGQMARGGLVLNLVGIVLITLFAFLLGGWALGMQF